MIKEYGITDFFTKQLDSNLIDKLTIGRIIADYGNGYKVVTQDGVFTGQISGKLRYSSDIYPVIGDFVTTSQVDKDTLQIHSVLQRRTAFKRKIAGNEFKEQVQGANFDYIFIVSSMNNDLNLRKLERYIITAWDTGAIPVIILTKADLCDNIEETKASIEGIAFGVNVHCVSSLHHYQLDVLNQYLIPGKTIALFGASGVGKSTLINTLAGKDILKVNQVREDDDRGRHTTTHRELVLLPNKTLIMDTPGMREIGVWDDGTGINHTFEDIVELELSCKFRNCTHTNEKGCQVTKAINEGLLEEKRYISYVKLKKEAAYTMRKAARKNLKQSKQKSIR